MGHFENHAKLVDLWQKSSKTALEISSDLAKYVSILCQSCSSLWSALLLGKKLCFFLKIWRTGASSPGPSNEDQWRPSLYEVYGLGRGGGPGTFCTICRESGPEAALQRDSLKPYQRPKPPQLCGALRQPRQNPKRTKIKTSCQALLKDQMQVKPTSIKQQRRQSRTT